jgi:hypothetical protein
MREPTMHMPPRWRDTDFGPRYFTEGWQDGIAGKENRYSTMRTDLELVRADGQAALTPYKDGFAPGQAAAGKHEKAGA